MKLQTLVLVGLLTLLSQGIIMAESSPSKTDVDKSTFEDLGFDEQEVATEKTFKGKPFSFFEVRPSIVPNSGKTYSENTVELGYQVTEDLKISYVQIFTVSKDFEWDDGFMRTRLANIWKSSDEKTVFFIQNRLYLPTIANKWPTDSADKGLTTKVKTYFELAHSLHERFSVGVAYVPSVFVYKKAGYETATKSKVNPLYEHAFTVTPIVKIIEDVTLILPVIYQLTKYRDYNASLALNNKFGHNLWIFPVVEMKAFQKQTFGVSYYSENLMKENNSGFQFAEGLKNGGIEFLWNIKL